jgi:hypothetical protein
MFLNQNYKKDPFSLLLRIDRINLSKEICLGDKLEHEYLSFTF